MYELNFERVGDCVEMNFPNEATLIVCFVSVSDLSNNQITKIEERICDDLCNLTLM